MYDFPTHSDMGEIVCIICCGHGCREFFTKADPYQRESVKRTIIQEEMPVDGQRNLLGRIREDEIFILDEIKGGDVLSFKK